MQPPSLMEPIDEHLIERYVRFPETLDEKTLRLIEDYIKHTPLAQATADFYRSFYRDLEDTSACLPDDVEAFSEALFQAPYVDARPPASPDAGVPPSVVTLSMQAFQTLGQDVQVITFTAPGQDVGILINYQPSVLTAQLQVVTATPHTGTYALISLPGLALDCLTDERGQGSFTLPSSLEPVEQRFATALFRRPLATFPLRATDFQETPPASRIHTEDLLSGYTLQCSFDGQRFTITSASPSTLDAPQAVLAAFAPDQGTPVLLHLDDGQVALDLDTLPDTFEIRLYG